MANQPCYVDGGENPLVKTIYYHYGLDVGGAEAMVDVVAATDGLVVSAGKAILPGYEDAPAKPRYDVVYLLDQRGWYYRYSHLHTIAAKVKGDPVMFLVRTFRTTDGKETWDFGDGSPKVVVQSDGNAVKLAKDGYARTVHTFKKAGHYLVRVERSDRAGYTAVAYLHVRVSKDPRGGPLEKK